MTELERELKATVRLQEEIFKRELQEIGDIYAKNMNEAKTIIERQSRLLGRYERELSNLKIELSESSIEPLQRQLSALEGELRGLSQDMNILLKKLE